MKTTLATSTTFNPAMPTSIITYADVAQLSTSTLLASGAFAAFTTVPDALAFMHTDLSTKADRAYAALVKHVATTCPLIDLPLAIERTTDGDEDGILSAYMAVKLAFEEAYLTEGMTKKAFKEMFTKNGLVGRLQRYLGYAEVRAAVVHASAAKTLVTFMSVLIKEHVNGKKGSMYVVGSDKRKLLLMGLLEANGVVTVGKASASNYLAVELTSQAKNVISTTSAEAVFRFHVTEKMLPKLSKNADMIGTLSPKAIAKEVKRTKKHTPLAGKAHDERERPNLIGDELANALVRFSNTAFRINTIGFRNKSAAYQEIGDHLKMMYMGKDYEEVMGYDKESLALRERKAAIAMELLVSHGGNAFTIDYKPDFAGRIYPLNPLLSFQNKAIRHLIELNTPYQLTEDGAKAILINITSVQGIEIALQEAAKTPLSDLLLTLNSTGIRKATDIKPMEHSLHIKLRGMFRDVIKFMDGETVMCRHITGMDVTNQGSQYIAIETRDKKLLNLAGLDTSTTAYAQHAIGILDGIVSNSDYSWRDMARDPKKFDDDMSIAALENNTEKSDIEWVLDRNLLNFIINVKNNKWNTMAIVYTKSTKASVAPTADFNKTYDIRVLDGLEIEEDAVYAYDYNYVREGVLNKSIKEAGVPLQVLLKIYGIDMDEDILISIFDQAVKHRVSPVIHKALGYYKTAVYSKGTKARLSDVMHYRTPCGYLAQISKPISFDITMHACNIDGSSRQHTATVTRNSVTNEEQSRFAPLSMQSRDSSVVVKLANKGAIVASTHDEYYTSMNDILVLDKHYKDVVVAELYHKDPTGRAILEAGGKVMKTTLASLGDGELSEETIRTAPFLITF